MELVKEIRICEVGLRDGLQNEPELLGVEEKLAYIDRLADAGVKVIEVGSFMHPKAVPQMANTDEVFRRLSRRDDVEYRALIPNVRGVERAIACGCTKVKLNVSASRAHNLANLNATPEETVAGFKAAVELAEANGITISGSISMPFGSPWEHEIPVEQVRRIVEAYLTEGISEISLSDASGMAYPSQVYELCHKMRDWYPEVSWWLHFHNTRGMALANVYAGMQAGFTQYDASLAGLGGCPFIPNAAGNLSTEDLAHMCEVMGIQTGLDTVQIMEMGNDLAERLKRGNLSYTAKAGRNSDLIRELPTGQGTNQTSK